MLVLSYQKTILLIYYLPIIRGQFKIKIFQWKYRCVWNFCCRGSYSLLKTCTVFINLRTLQLLLWGGIYTMMLTLFIYYSHPVVCYIYEKDDDIKYSKSKRKKRDKKENRWKCTKQDSSDSSSSDSDLCN